MKLDDYLIDQSGYDWSSLLQDLGSLLPRDFTLWMVNRFGELFIIPKDGSVHMVDVGGGKIERIANDREDFAERIDVADNANQWLMIPLVDECFSAGLVLRHGQCYSFKQPPLLGGDYTIDNVEVSDLAIHYSILGQIYEQTKDLPDGTSVNVKLGDE